MNASNYAQWFTKAALAAMLAFALAATALAGGNPPDDMNGVWTGETASGQTSAITLTLGEASSSLRYGNPRSCILGLEDAIDNPDGSRKYALATSTGGRCDDFLNCKLVLRHAGSSALDYEIKDTGGKSVEQGQLRRRAARK
ncbi:hypothetical protein SAMN04488503_1286 [Humidesulfovibrio mexicanus]|uniref:Protease inhibitor Inh n=1 Tax=Humidesulfovibrio mexicanus TaxID=147047 RepID=A0A238Z623_9BACT|nr:hypothetical protein [Humidesulfovibrio mexicanus]SNR78867.1 hypothetical protein SAMN04488503_1286 [Humidesulfovibrio mexicanus]